MLDVYSRYGPEAVHTLQLGSYPDTDCSQERMDGGWANNSGDMEEKESCIFFDSEQR